MVPKWGHTGTIKTRNYKTVCGDKVTEREKVVSVNVDVTFINIIKAHRIVDLMHAAHHTLIVVRGGRLRR